MMKVPSYRPQLQVSDNLVARALEHTWALRKIYAEMRQREFDRIRRGAIVVKRLPYAGPNAMRRGSSKFLDLLR